MSDSPPDDDDGRTVIPLLGRQTTRRGVLGAAAAMLGSSLYASAAEQHTVGGDNAVMGGQWQPSMHSLTQAGTLRELVVVAIPEHFPDAPRYEPALWLPLDGTPVMHAGTAPYSSTSELWTNVGSIDVADDSINLGGTDPPVLGVALDTVDIILDGAPSERSSVGGGTKYVDAADTNSNWPSRTETPYLQWSLDADGVEVVT